MFSLFSKTTDPRKLARKASRTKNQEEAISLYSDAIKVEKEKESPDKDFLSNLYLMRGEIYLSQSEATLSSSDLLDSIKFNPKNGIAHNDLGIWFTIESFNTPDYDRALDHLNKAIEFRPDRWDFKMNKAIVKVKMGDKETGRQELEKLLDDGYPEAEVALEKFCN